MPIPQKHIYHCIFYHGNKQLHSRYYWSFYPIFLFNTVFKRNTQNVGNLAIKDIIPNTILLLSVNKLIFYEMHEHQIQTNVIALTGIYAHHKSWLTRNLCTLTNNVGL